MLDKKIHQFIVPDNNANERLDQVIAKLLPEYSRTQIKTWIEAGLVLVNGQCLKAKTRLNGGEEVSVTVRTRPESTLEAQAIALSIVYEDDAILIIDKPVGLVVHPGAGNSDKTLLNALLHHDPGLRSLPRAGILHRLDKETSGLLAIAKTEEAYQQLSQQLKKRLFLREYQAIVNGKLISGGTINVPITRHPIQRKRMAVSEIGKEAITHYRVLEKFRAHTLLKIRLETGRTHQIRVHLSHIKHPIVGDIVYGGRVQLAKNMPNDLITLLRQFKHQALHAYLLGFLHPSTQEFMQWESPLPADMSALIISLREDTRGV